MLWLMKPKGSTMNTSVLPPALAIAVRAPTACSGPSTPAADEKSEKEKAEAAAPAEPVTAKTAFYKMFKEAHAWAPDMVPLTIEAKSLSAVKNEGGKAGMWQATFGSPSKKQYATFTYAVAAQPPDIRKGVTA